MRATLFRDLPTEGWFSMERYADELAAALKHIGCDTHPFVAARPLPQVRGKIGALLNYAWRSTLYPLAARRQQRDLNHILDHSYAHLIHALDACKTVVTCHDIAPLELDQRGRGLSRRLWDRSFRAMLRAAHIIADSAHTRDAILRHSDYPTNRITVIPLGVSPAFFDPGLPLDLRALREWYNLIDKRVLLHVGACQPRKNIEAIFYALTQLRDLDAAFVQIGGRFSPDQTRLISQSGLSGCIIQINSTSERDLRLWYQTADVLVFPSFYEGFGLPILEAMASGTPVICSNATSLPEVADDATLLIDPKDWRTLSGALQAVLTNEGLRLSLIERGRDRAALFTWERCAQETLATYHRTTQH